TFLPFDAKSSVWEDVKPVPQDDGPAPLCPILYSPNYSQAMDLLRALLPKDELSPRTLALTEHLSKLCPSSYTVWFYRARILINGPEDGPNGLGNKKQRLENELVYLNDLAKNNMKNYQVWQHRKLIVTALGDPSHELEFAARVLQEDSKNYNTWVYRQWVLSYFGGLPIQSEKVTSVVDQSPSSAGKYPQIWEGEGQYIAQMLQMDARNNSAWNHRYFCLFASKWVQSVEKDASAKHLCGEAWKVGKTKEECIKNEIAFTKDCIKMIPNNASAWNYLRGVVSLLKSNDPSVNPYAVATDLALSLLPTAQEALQDPSVDAPPRSPPLALEWLLDDVEAKMAFEKDEAKKQELDKQAESIVGRL
ncbi:protein prenylyltransferase, partial [Meira miltonrushii]